jgi:hypothetical protein
VESSRYTRNTVSSHLTDSCQKDGLALIAYLSSLDHFVVESTDFNEVKDFANQVIESKQFIHGIASIFN